MTREQAIAEAKELATLDWRRKSHSEKVSISKRLQELFVSYRLTWLDLKGVSK